LAYRIGNRPDCVYGRYENIGAACFVFVLCERQQGIQAYQLFIDYFRILNFPYFDDFVTVVERVILQMMSADVMFFKEIYHCLFDGRQASFMVGQILPYIGPVAQHAVWQCFVFVAHWFEVDDRAPIDPFYIVQQRFSFYP
jgi:hypothetical protein